MVQVYLMAKSEGKDKKPGEARHSTASEDYQIRLSVLVYALAAFAVGYASLMISPLTGNMLMLFIVLVLAWAVGRVVQSLVGKKDAKWLLGNGLIIYLFFWLVSYIFFFNLLG